MKINPINNPTILQSYRANKSFKKEGAAAAYGADEVSFSKEALSFSKLMSEVREQIDVSSPTQRSRIDELKTAVQNGTYRVDSGKIADSILGLFGNA